MKNLSISLFALAFAAVLPSCGNNGGNGTPAEAYLPDSVRASVPSGTIAYIQMDSLYSNYDMFQELSQEFQAKSEKAETELTNKGRSLEREYNSYVEKASKGLITRSQAQSMEEDLTRKQQSFMDQRDRLLGELAEEEQVMFNRIFHSIQEYLDLFNADKRYSMIISTNSGGPILNADPALDITREIIEGINRHYAANRDND